MLKRRFIRTSSIKYQIVRENFQKNEIESQ